MLQTLRKCAGLSPHNHAEPRLFSILQESTPPSRLCSDRSIFIPTLHNQVCRFPAFTISVRLNHSNDIPLHISIVRTWLFLGTLDRTRRDSRGFDKGKGIRKQRTTMGMKAPRDDNSKCESFTKRESGQKRGSPILRAQILSYHSQRR